MKTLKDKSGNGNDLFQSNPKHQPTSMRGKVVPNLADAMGMDALYDLTRPMLKKYAEKLKTFLPETQKFYLTCRDLEVGKLYKVAGYERQMLGIDILQTLDIIMREKNDPMNNIRVKGGLYFDKNDKCVGFISASGPTLFEYDGSKLNP